MNWTKSVLTPLSQHLRGHRSERFALNTATAQPQTPSAQAIKDTHRFRVVAPCSHL